MSWRLRGCRHCGGDTFLDKDLNDVWNESCLQCGYDAVLMEIDNKLEVVKPLIMLDVRQVIKSR